MIAITTLLAHLTRPEVTEVELVTGRRPVVRLGGALQEIDAEPLSADDLLRILFSAGGSRYVESLGPKPAQWRTRVEGVGAVNVSAAMNDDVIEARFTLRDAGATAPQPQPPKPRGPSAPPPKRHASGQPRALEGAPSSQPPAVTRSPRPVTSPPARPTPKPPWGRPSREGAALSAQAFELDDGERPSDLPTPPRGIELPRAALPSDLEIDLDTEIPSVPRPAVPARRPSPEHRSPRSPRRITRPFEREPQTTAFRQLLRVARDLSASDLHLVAGRPPLLRVAGQIVPHGDALDPQVVEDLILSRIPRRLEAVLERDGSCDFAVAEPELGRCRVNVSRQRTGLKASLRLVSLYVPTLAMLGLPEAIGGATRHHQGLIVLTGPTGHGKTTTLAAVVDILNTESSRHVITVEDPIEYIHPHKRAMMSQREVGTHTRSFQSALKAALREDPDVIVVGELRDTETVRIALEASETGHLVLGTMSTPSAAKAIDRIIDLFPPADQQQVRMTLAGGLRLIVSQRLLPDTEGKSMVAAAEVLPGILPLWNLIRENRTYQIPSLQQRGKELGVIRLDDSLRELVRAGRVTAAAAVAVAEAPDELEQSLGIRRPSIAGIPYAQSPAGRPSGPHDRGSSRPPGHDGGSAPKPPTPEPKGIFDRVFKKGS